MRFECYSNLSTSNDIMLSFPMRMAVINAALKRAIYYLQCSYAALIGWNFLFI